MINAVAVTFMRVTKIGYCVVQFTDEEEQLQQIRGLGTDIAVVRYFLPFTS